MNFNDECLEVIKNLINELCPDKRKSKYSIDYYLKYCVHALKDVVSWKALGNLLEGTKKYHYKTIASKFLEWSKLKIFEKAHTILLKRHALKDTTTSTTLNLYIDSSNINNKNGVKLINFGQNKKTDILFFHS